MVGDEVILAKEWIKYKKRYFSNMEQGCFRRSSKSASLFRAMRILIYTGFVICVIPLLFMILESVFGWWGWDDSRLTSIYLCVILAWLAIFIVVYVIASRVGVFLRGLMKGVAIRALSCGAFWRERVWLLNGRLAFC